MNKKMIRKFATVALGAGLVLGTAPAAFAVTDPTPDYDVLGVIHTDGEQDIVAITTEIDPGIINVGPDGIVGQVAYPCEDLDESVRVPVEGQPNYCYVNRSHLARDLGPGDLSFPTANVDPATGIQAISAPLNWANPATDAATSGKVLAIALSALAVGGTAFTLSRRNRVGAEA